MANMTKGFNRMPVDDEIEAEVLAKRGDESAWDVLPVVSASKSARPGWMLNARHLDLAAKFHILYFLHLLGLEANLSMSHPDNVDITVLREAGQALTIDVKMLPDTRAWRIDPFTAKPGHFIAFVVFEATVFHPNFVPQVYITASEALHVFVDRYNLESVSLEILARELNTENGWNQLVSASRPDSA